MQSVYGRYCHSVAVENAQSNQAEDHHQQNFPGREVALKCSANNARIHGDSAPGCIRQPQ